MQIENFEGTQTIDSMDVAVIRQEFYYQKYEKGVVI